MAGDSKRPRPFLDDLDESTVVGQPDVVPLTRSYKKPFLLQQIEGPGSPRRYLLELDEIVVGRSHQAHISIDSGLLSRKHMSLRKAGLEYVAADLDSSNGMFLNGVRAHSAVLREGDIISIDYGAKLAGYCADAAITVGVGEVSEVNRRLMEVTKGALDIAIAGARPNVKWSAIAGRMQRFVESAGFSVVRELVGHGIGRQMHEEPQVPNYVSRELLENDFTLAEGFVFAVEPMINVGTSAIRTLRDGWTIVTRDGKCSAHFEHTIVITKGGCEVLTAG